MPDAPHQIRRLRWHVRVPSAEAAFALRQALRARLEPELLSALGRAFDRRAVGDAEVHVPRLTLRLSLPAGGDPIADLARQIEEQLDEALAKAEADGPPRPAR